MGSGIVDLILAPLAVVAGVILYRRNEGLDRWFTLYMFVMAVLLVKTGIEDL